MLDCSCTKNKKFNRECKEAMFCLEKTEPPWVMIVEVNSTKPQLYMKGKEMNILKNLKKALRLIKDSKSWTLNAEARDKWRNVVDPLSPKAVKFSALGAIKRIKWSADVNDEISAIKLYVGTKTARNATTHQEVIHIFKTTIQEMSK